MKKNAQISVYVIISVMFILFFTVFTSISNEKKIQELEKNQKLILEKINPEFENIKKNIQNCFDENLKDATYFNSMQGGYYYYNGNGAEYYDLYIPYYIEDNTLKIPEIKTIENQLEQYVNYETFTCIEKYEYELNEREYNLTYGNISSKIIIDNNSIINEINFPLTIHYQGQSISYNNFNSKYKYDLLTKYNIINEYVNTHITKNYPAIPLESLTKLATENNFIYEYYSYDNNSVVYMFTFDEGEDKKPLIYSFVISYNFGEEKNEI